VPRILAVALDVDGVLTDGTFWWGPDGSEFKRFSFRDVMGISRGRQRGLRFALVSGEDVPQVHRFAAKMGIDDVYVGCKDKAAALRDFAARRGLDLLGVAFMGDDVNDLPALAIVGLSAAPCDAEPSVLQCVGMVSRFPGGRGAVRELIEHILDGTEDATCP